MSVKMRQIVEREIYTAVITELLKAGFSLSIDNGDNSGTPDQRYEIENSTDKAAILKAMYLTDEDMLYARSNRVNGWVRFIYGNDGWDVINDYSVNLEEYITKGLVQKTVDKYSD